MNQTEEFDKRLEEAGFDEAERNTIKFISREAGLKFVRVNQWGVGEGTDNFIEEIQI